MIRLFYCLILVVVLSTRSEGQCHGEYKKLVVDTVELPCDSMVLMNLETYADYYHKANNLKVMGSINDSIQSKLDSLWKIEKDKVVEFDNVVDISEECVDDNKELVEDVRRKDKKIAKLTKRVLVIGAIAIIELIILALHK
jgi:hypothetical protein